MPLVFVHDLDPLLVSELWTSLCAAANAKCRTSAAYHHQANGQSERSVQTLVIALRATMGGLFKQDEWTLRLPHVVFCLNSACSSSTNVSPYEALYGRPPSHFLSPASINNPQGFGEQQKVIRQEAWDQIKLAEARIKIYYDQRHITPPEINDVKDLVYMKLAKPAEDGYHYNNQSKISHRRAGLFTVLEKISKLRYQLDLPPWLK